MWYVNVNGGVLVNSAREMRSGRHVKPGPILNAPRRASRMMLPGSRLSPHLTRKTLRHGGSRIVPTSTVPPRRGVSASGAPARGRDGDEERGGERGR